MTAARVPVKDCIVVSAIASTLYTAAAFPIPSLDRRRIALDQFAAWHDLFYACRPKNRTLDSQRPSMLAEVGTLSIPP
jgi:hypothetical protein